MATILRTDPERGPGYARICLDAGSSPLPSMPQGCAFTLQRASDALFLAHNGWQESQTELTPDALARQDSTLELSIGPDVVDNLDILNTYRIHLRHTTLPPTVIQIESLDYSPLKGKEGLHIATPVAAPVVEAPSVQAPVVEEAVVEEPVTAAPVKAESLEPSPPPLTMATEEPQAAGKKNTFLVLLLLLLVAGAGAAAGLYWYNQHLAKPAVQEAPVPPPASSEASKAAEASKPAEAPAALSPLAQARQLLQGKGDAAQSLALARQLQAGQDGQNATNPAVQSQRADAVFLLLEDAAQKGQGEAMILLARYFDPIDKAPKGSIQSDPQQALHWYTAARAAGQASAADSGINALRQWASTAAAAGDKAAQELLRGLN